MRPPQLNKSIFSNKYQELRGKEVTPSKHLSPRAGLPIRLGQAARSPAVALRPLGELCPSPAARQYSPRVPSPQPRLPCKMVCNVWGGAYPRHLRVRSANGISTARSCIIHTTLSRTVNQALDLLSDTAAVVYVSLVSRGGCGHGGRNRKSRAYRGLCDISRRHVTRLRWMVVGCVPLVAVWVCCFSAEWSAVILSRNRRSTKGTELNRAIYQQGVTNTFGIRSPRFPYTPGIPRGGTRLAGPGNVPGKSTAPTWLISDCSSPMPSRHGTVQPFANASNLVLSGLTGNTLSCDRPG